MSGVIAYYDLATPDVTDIAHLLPTDNLIAVEAGGEVTFHNEYGYAVPNRIVFCENTNKLIGSDQFVGDLVGMATRALRDGAGNVIQETYVSKSELDAVLATLATSLSGASVD